MFNRSRRKEDYYNSFSIHYVKAKEARTLDVVCETDAEMEAWVIGLCHLAKVGPKFGERMIIPEALRVPEVSADDLDALCAPWHVTPKVLHAVRKRIADLENAKNRKIRLTPGDLRYLMRLDIFRANAVWKALVDAHTILPTAGKLMQYLDYGASE